MYEFSIEKEVSLCYPVLSLQIAIFILFTNSLKYNEILNKLDSTSNVV
jgi:hypothetical protein